MQLPALLPIEWEPSSETTFRAQRHPRPTGTLSVFAMAEMARLAAEHPGFELVELKKLSQGAVSLTYRMPGGALERMLVVDRDGETWTIRFAQVETRLAASA